MFEISYCLNFILNDSFKYGENFVNKAWNFRKLNYVSICSSKNPPFLILIFIHLAFNHTVNLWINIEDA